MQLKTLKNTNVSNKTVLYRAPYDIGVKKDGNEYIIKDNSRIVATLDTLKYLMDQKCKIVILTYVKRPDGKVVEELRTTPHAKELGKLLGVTVKKVDDCIGTNVQAAVDSLNYGEILMLENVRFYPEENEDNDEFAKKLCEGMDICVFDGFPQAHRANSSTTGILRHLPGVAGFYFQREVEALNELIESPKKPFTLIIGGAKVSDKVDAVNNLMDKVDNILVGGGTANVFLKAKGYEIGNSFVEDVFVGDGEKKDWVQYAKEILGNTNKVHVPEDVVVSMSIEEPIGVRTVELKEGLNQNEMAVDIGPKTIQTYKKIIQVSNTVFLNGNMGVSEVEGFSDGTKQIANALADSSGMTVIGGGDTIEAVKAYGDINKISHVSLAGGATLEFLAGKKLPALEMLKT